MFEIVFEVISVLFQKAKALAFSQCIVVKAHIKNKATK